MNDGYLTPTIKMRMGVSFTRRAMRRPTRVSDAYRAGIFLRRHLFLQSGDRADFFLHKKIITVQYTNPGAIIASVF